MKTNKLSGFTLVELAIVIILIGALVAALVSGKDMLDINKRNRVMTDLQIYRDATVQFKEKYRFLPGDYPYAKDTFPIVSDTLGNVILNSGDSTAGGDDNIDYDMGSIPALSGAKESSEELLAWSQLGREKFITKAYSGWPSNGVSTVIGFDLPASSYKNVAFRFVDRVNAAFFDDFYVDMNVASNDLVPPAITLGSGTGFEGFTTPENIYRIDLKMDDGKPNMGDVMNLQNIPVGGGCSTGTEESSAYVFSYTGNNCSLVYLIRAVE